jgi:biotin carboxyl carrier protein
MKLTAQVGTEERPLTIEHGDAPHTWRVNDKLVEARRTASGWSLLVDGKIYAVDVDPGKADGELLVEVRGLTVPVKVLDPRRQILETARKTHTRSSSGPQPINAPMPGKVVKILVKPGDTVTLGQPIAVVEAMKMENELKAPRDGKITTVHVSEGQAVDGQTALMTIE